MLVGFSGAGKSSLGLEVAKRLQIDFIDTDQLIEAQMGMGMEEIWSKFGADYFRVLERQFALISEQTTSFKGIIASGGGFPFYYNSMSELNQYYHTIYLHRPWSFFVQQYPEYSKYKMRYKNDILKLEQLYLSRVDGYVLANQLINLKEQKKINIALLENCVKSYFISLK